MLDAKLCLWVALLLAVASPARPPQVPTGLERKLSERVPAYALDEWGLAPALMAASSTFRIPMGIECIGEREPKRVVLSWKGATVRQILESVVRTHAGYRLEVQQGLVGVFYAGATEDKANFLNIRLPDFPVRNQYAAVALVSLQRVLKQRLLASPPENQWFGHVMVEAQDRPVTLDFRSATGREILDSLTLQSGRQVWVVTFRQDAKMTPAGFRRTMTIWNDHPISDEYQPVWDTYRWGDPLPPSPAPRTQDASRNAESR